jgi:hypothetical protein
MKQTDKYIQWKVITIKKSKCMNAKNILQSDRCFTYTLKKKTLYEVIQFAQLVNGVKSKGVSILMSASYFEVHQKYKMGV